MIGGLFAAVASCSQAFRQRQPVGEHRVVPVGGEQLALVVRVHVLHTAHDQPGRDVLGLGSRGERGVADLGDLRVTDPLLGVLVEDGVGVVDRIQAWSPMLEIALRTDLSCRAVMEKHAPWRTEFAPPLRSRAAAISGAEPGVETTASNACSTSLRPPHRWQHRRTPWSPGAARRMAAEGWTRVPGPTFPWGYFKRRTD